MNKNSFLYFFTCSLIYGIGIFYPINCLSQEFYTPENGLNSLTFSKKNEIKFSYLLPSKILGSKFIVGYSPFNHLSIEIGFLNTDLSFNRREIKHTYLGKNYTIGIGTFKYLTLAKGRLNKNIYLKLNAKFGYTHGAINSKFDKFHSDFRYQKLFTQIGFGMENGIYGFDMFIKYNHLTFLEGRILRIESNIELVDTIKKIEEKNHFNMMEYKVQFYGGFGFLKAILGLSFEFNIDDNRYNFLESGSPYFGIILNIHELKSNKVSKPLESMK